MARTDWVALITEPAAEYTARTELERLGLSPYLPQLHRRWLPPHTNAYRYRCYPLFPRYLLLPIAEADPDVIRIARGLRRHRPLLATGEGAPWRAPAPVIEVLKKSEANGDFYEKLPKGAHILLTASTLDLGLITTPTPTRRDLIELFTPLLGGARILVRSARARVDVSRV